MRWMIPLKVLITWTGQSWEKMCASEWCHFSFGEKDENSGVFFVDRWPRASMEKDFGMMIDPPRYCKFYRFLNDWNDPDRTMLEDWTACVERLEMSSGLKGPMGVKSWAKLWNCRAFGAIWSWLVQYQRLWMWIIKPAKVHLGRENDLPNIPGRCYGCWKKSPCAIYFISISSKRSLSD